MCVLGGLDFKVLLYLSVFTLLPQTHLQVWIHVCRPFDSILHDEIHKLEDVVCVERGKASRSLKEYTAK